MKLWSRRSLLGGSVALAFAANDAAQAEDYPTRPITAVIPFAAGSASDVVSRILFDRMSKSLGQPIIVENCPGAGGNIGSAFVAKDKPDGYTLLGGGSGPVAANVTLYNHLDYDPVQDFETISPFAGFTIVVAVTSKLPINSLQELISYAKAHPGELNYGSVGIGSSQHLAGEYFGQLTGTEADPRSLQEHWPVSAGSNVRRRTAWVPVVPERVICASGQRGEGLGCCRAQSAGHLAGYADEQGSGFAGLCRVGMVCAACS